MVVLAGTEWNPLWQGAQELSSRLARGGHRVLFVENLGARAPGWKDTRRVLRRMGSWAAQTARHTGEAHATLVAPRLWVHTPIVLPPFGPAYSRAANRRFFLPRVRRVADAIGMRDVLVITLLATDLVLDLVELFRASGDSRVVYWCTTDVSVLDPGGPEGPRGRALVQAEAALLRGADLVLATLPALERRCAAGAANVRAFSHGVNLDAFPFTPRPPGSRASHPVIGYVGGLHRHVDFDLLARCARMRPEWRWELVGPWHSPAARALAELHNVRLLGPRPHAELASHIARWSACLIPYRRNTYTESVVPTKLNEYLAVGRPVVATRIPSVETFAARHEGVFMADNEPEPFVRAVEDALRTAWDPRASERRRAVAALSSWDARMTDLEGWLRQMDGGA